MKSLRRIAAIIGKEFRQLRRDRVTFGMVVMIPLIQLLLFGYAINTDVRNLPIAVLDYADNSYSRQLIDSVRQTQVVNIEHRFLAMADAEQLLREGGIKAALIVPQDLSSRMQQQQPLAQWLVDGSDTMVTSALLRLQNMPMQDILAGGGSRLRSEFEMTILYNPERRSAINIVPGLVGVILTMTMILFTSAALVRERERGNLEMLITTPVKPMELMVGKVVPYIFIGLIQVSIILGLGYFIFEVPINGSMLHLLTAALLFIAASLVLGLIISTLATTQLQAMQMTVFILMPSILLSGFMFPYDAMPVPAQWISEVLPATHFIRMIRGVVLRTAGLPDLLPDAIWLIGFTLIGLVIASLRFKKRLD